MERSEGLERHAWLGGMASALDEHRVRLLLISYFSIVLHDSLRRSGKGPEPLATLILVGGVLFVTLHAVSDIGITGLLGSKLSSFESDGGDHLIPRNGVLPRWLGFVAPAAAVLSSSRTLGSAG
jgi:hypothetical protein